MGSGASTLLNPARLDLDFGLGIIGLAGHLAGKSVIALRAHHLLVVVEFRQMFGAFFHRYGAGLAYSRPARERNAGSLLYIHEILPFLERDFFAFDYYVCHLDCVL